MAAERYPQTRGNPVKFDSVDVGNLAPITERSSLEAGRLFNIHHLFGDAIGTGSGAVIEGISILMGYNPTTASTALLECIDATAVSQGSHSGTIQSFNAAISKSSATTTPLAIAQALWPGYVHSAGTITALYGSYVYGTALTTGGTIVDMTAFGAGPNALAITGTKRGMHIGAISGVAEFRYGIEVAGQTGSGETGIAAGIKVTEPLGGTFSIGLWLAASASTPPTLMFSNGEGTPKSITHTMPNAGVTSYSLIWPPDVGADGEQLQIDVTGTVGTLTWEAAASTREVKDLEGFMEPAEALRRIQSAPVHRFHYKRDKRGVGKDYETEFVGIVADEAPWAMKHQGRIFNPINAFGHAAAAIQALAAKVEALEAKVA